MISSNMVLMLFVYIMLLLILILFIIYAVIKIKKRNRPTSNNYMSELNEAHIKGKISEKEFLSKKKSIK